MQERVVIRLWNGEPVWHPPGSGGEARSLGDPAEADRLAALAATHRAQLVFAAPGEDISLREVEFTAVERRHVARSLPYLLEEEFAAPVETLHFASRATSRLSLGVAACSHDRMGQWKEQLTGLPDLPLWVPEPLLLPWRDGELCLLMEPRRVLVRTGRNGGFCIDRELARTALDALAADGAFDAVVVYGQDPEADQALLPDALRDVMQWRTGGFAEALMLLEEEGPALNLRQGDYGPRLPLGQWWRQWRLVAGLFGAAFCLQVLGTWADYSRLERENVALRQQVEAAFREVVPRGSAANPERQLRRRLEELRGNRSGIGFVGMVERIGRVVQAEPGARLTSASFSDRAGDVRFNILAPDFGAVESIRARMDEAGLDVRMESSSVQGDSVRARLRIKEKGA